MYKHYLILSLLIFSFIVSGYTLKGGVSYTVETARTDAFSNVSMKIDLLEYENFIEDKNFNSNMHHLQKNKKKYKDRYLTLYSDGTYTVRYINEKNIAYLYNKNGQLIGITFDIGNNYPSKRITYDYTGNFDSVTLDVSKDEQFIFDINKKLVAHWIGKNCYNEQGELINTRN